MLHEYSDRPKAAFFSSNRSVVYDEDSATKSFVPYLQKNIQNKSRDGVCLLIVEGLNRDVVEMLNVELQVPNYVFELHRMHPNDHVLGVSRIPVGESPNNHFILNYRQPLPFRSKGARTCECASSKKTGGPH